ncbi:MAG: hypothetical protein R3B96_13405 [Pirellulaceae bacterium]
MKPPQPDLWIYVGYSSSNTVRFVADTTRTRRTGERSTPSSSERLLHRR